MKITHVLATVLMASTTVLAACQTTPAPMTPNASVTLPLSDSKLQHYHWQLTAVTDRAGKPIKPQLFSQPKPLVVAFEQGGKVRFANACNQMWGNYVLTNDNILVSNIAATQMLCEPDLMAFEAAAPSTLKGQFKLTQDAHGQPLLTVTDTNQISSFKPVAK